MKNLIKYVIMNDESLLYDSHLERVKGIEPSYPAWKAGALADVLYPHKRGVGIRPREDKDFKKGEKIFFLILVYILYQKFFEKSTFFLTLDLKIFAQLLTRRSQESQKKCRLSK